MVKLATKEVEHQVTTNESPPTEVVVDETPPTGDMPPKKVGCTDFLVLSCYCKLDVLYF